MTSNPHAPDPTTGEAHGSAASSPLRNRHLVGGAAAACAVCCAAPVVGFLGVAGLAATAVTLAFAGVVFALVVGLAALAAVLVRRRRSRDTACAPGEPAGPVTLDLGLTRTNDPA